MKRTRLSIATALAVGATAAAALAIAPSFAAQAPGPAGAPAAPAAGDGAAGGGLRNRLGVVDPAAAQRGSDLYRPSCGFCHGIEGRGGLGTNLTASLYVVGDPSGKPLHDFLQVGRPATGMPPFPQFTPEQVRDITAYLQARANEGGRRRDIDPNAILVGNAQAGKAYFEGDGGCAKCHSATGDFAGIGGRYTPMILQARMINPKTVGRGQGRPPAPPPATVRVTLQGGQVVQGRLVQVNDFFVTLVDQGGVRRTIERNNETPKVEITDPLEAHRQQMLKWTDQNMWNVTAYLASLK